jgi:hypothetical protein
MKKNKIKILISFIIILVIYLQFFNEKSGFVLTDEIKKENTVNNYINNKEIENIIYVGLDVLDVNYVNVNIIYIPKIYESFVKDNIIYRFDAIITNDLDNNYTIYINKNINNNEILLTLSHELIHLAQYHHNYLKVIKEYSIFIYKNIIYHNNIDYYKRPWEIEAYENQEYVKSRILSILY